MHGGAVDRVLKNPVDADVMLLPSAGGGIPGMCAGRTNGSRMAPPAEAQIDQFHAGKAGRNEGRCVLGLRRGAVDDRAAGGADIL